MPTLFHCLFAKKPSRYFKKSSFILSEDLSDIPSDTYDVVLSVTSTYCLNHQTLLNFLSAVKRILKKRGVFIWYDTILSLEDVINYIKSTIRHLLPGGKSDQKGVLWGWKRSLSDQSSLAQLEGLTWGENYYFDKNNSLISPSKLMGLPHGNLLSWQAGIYHS